MPRRPPSTTSWPWRPGRSSPRTRASAASCDNARNLSDAHAARHRRDRRPLGIGFWPTACGGDDAASIARSIRYAVDVAGIEHVGLGSDFDGAVPVPFDATGLVQLTDALLEAGFDDDDIAKVMGGNARRAARRRRCPTTA